MRGHVVHDHVVVDVHPEVVGVQEANSTTIILSDVGLKALRNGEVAVVNGTRTGIGFRFEDPTGHNERRRLSLEATSVTATSDFVQFGQSALATPATQSQRFTLVVGKDSAALLVNGKVGAAIRLQGPVTVLAESHGAASELRDLKISPMPAASGCRG